MPNETPVEIDLTKDKIPARLPLHEFVQDADLMKALIRGVRAMKNRKASDPLSWFFQAAIHGVPPNMVALEIVRDPGVEGVDQKKYWNQCPHSGQGSANFLPWHRGYTYYFERILRAHTGEPRFALPYWDYSIPENYKFPKEFGTTKLPTAVDGLIDNPLWHEERNFYFASWEHWAGNNLPYSQLTPQAVDWSQARDSVVFFGKTEEEGLAGAVLDDDTQTRGRLESFPHDPIHRLTGIIIPPHTIPDPNKPGQVIIISGDALGMAKPPTAGFDPIFCVHHSNIDRLWAEWSCMEGKEWGNFPAPDWFDEKPWFFYDVTLEVGQLIPVEVNLPRKNYFDSRALGISFKNEDLTKTPLKLPDPIPSSPTAGIVPLAPTLIAKIENAQSISWLRPERVQLTALASEMKENFAATKARFSSLDANQSKNRRVIMQMNGVDLSGIQATGFDVHLTTNTSEVPTRNAPSYVGSIALFRHDKHQHTHHHEHGHEHGHSNHGHHDNSTGQEQKSFVDRFDVTNALIVAGETDPSNMQVVIVPFSLSSTIKDGQPIIEAAALTFQSIEFFAHE